jgi:NADH-quinone oxidoreductase subunit M
VFFVFGLLSFLYAARVIYWIFINNQDYSAFFEDLKKRKNNYPIFSTDILALLIGILGIISVSLWPEMPGQILESLAVKDFHNLSGIRDTVLFILLSAYIFNNNQFFKVKARENLSLENYFQQMLSFIYGMSRKSIKLDTEKIFETFFIEAIFSASSTLRKFIYQDFTVQLLWIPIFLTLLLFWQQIYTYF